MTRYDKAIEAIKHLEEKVDIHEYGFKEFYDDLDALYYALEDLQKYEKALDEACERLSLWATDTCKGYPTYEPLNKEDWKVYLTSSKEQWKEWLLKDEK